MSEPKIDLTPRFGTESPRNHLDFPNDDSEDDDSEDATPEERAFAIAAIGFDPRLEYPDA